MLVAADTNVLMDLAAEVESVVDALDLVRQRLTEVRLVVLQTVVQELRCRFESVGRVGSRHRFSVRDCPQILPLTMIRWRIGQTRNALASL